MTGRTLTELTRIKNQTIDEEWLKADLVAINGNTSSIMLTVRLPTEEERIWEVEKPPIWTDDYTLVRLVEGLDYTAETIDLLAGESVRIRPITESPAGSMDTTHTWELAVPDPRTEPTHSMPVLIGKGILHIIGLILGVIGIYCLVGIPIVAMGVIATGLVSHPLLTEFVYWTCLVGWLITGAAAMANAAGHIVKTDRKAIRRKQ